MSRSSCVILWEKDVGQMKEGQSYKLVGATVHSSNGIKYDSVCGDCVMEDIDDIVEIALWALPVG